MNIKKRSFSRLIAIQVLYQYDFFKGDEGINKIKADVLDYYLKFGSADLDEKIEKAKKVAESTKENPNLSKMVDLDFLDLILDSIFENLKEIDGTIQEFIADKEGAQKTEELLREILRFGVLELKFIKDAPKNVIINEYANITGQFYEKNIVNFVNGVLENIAKTVSLA